MARPRGGPEIPRRDIRTDENTGVTTAGGHTDRKGVRENGHKKETDGKTNGETDGSTDGKRDETTDGKTDRETDGRTEKNSEPTEEGRQAGERTTNKHKNRRGGKETTP